MASCVLLWLLYCCCRWCRWCRCLRQLFSFYEQCEKKKAASPHPERTNLCFFPAAVGISFCVINSSIVGGFDLEVVV